MASIHFIHENDPCEADVLIVSDKWTCETLDKKLKGAISRHLKKKNFEWQAGGTVWITPKTPFPIPQIIVTTHFSIPLEKKRVAVVLDSLLSKKIADKLLPQVETLFFLCKDPKQSKKNFKPYQYLLEAIEYSKKWTATAAQCHRLEKQGVHITKKLKTPSHFMVMEWKGSTADPIVLLGVGTNASGVVGTLDAVARFQLPIHVVGITMDDQSYLEEGLIYAQKAFSPRLLIDLSKMVTEIHKMFGGAFSGLFCTEETLAHQLLAAGEASGEKLWRLPLDDTNYLHPLIKPGLPWAHLALTESIGIKLLMDFLKVNRTYFFPSLVHRAARSPLRPTR